MKRALMCLALVGSFGSFGLAQRATPVQARLDRKVRPLSYQAIGADRKPLGPVYPYQEGGIAQSEVLAFDCFGPDATGTPTDGLYGVDCGLGSGRWYLGTNFHNPHYAFDIHLSPGTQGKLATRMEFAWFDFRPMGDEHFYVVMWPVEDYDASCAGPAFTSTFGGIIFNFGMLYPDNYYYTNIAHIAIPFQLPLDGVGGVEVVYAQAVTASSIVFISPCVQPMLWGTFDPGCDPPGTNTSFQVGTQWDDTNPLDGTFGYPAIGLPSECKDYHYGVCPDPLGAMYCFYVSSGPDGVRCDANCDGVLDGFDIEPFFLLLTNIDYWTFRYPGCDALDAGDANCDGYVDGFDIDPFFNGLTAGECACY
jgi:hypothetical protein